MKPEPFDYLPRPAFDKLLCRKFMRKMPYQTIKKQGEYSGQVDAISEKPEGRGIMICTDGELFEGHWKAGQKEYGRKMASDGQREYVGAFENDTYNGYGICTRANGLRYEGNWINGKPVVGGMAMESKFGSM